MSESNPTRLHDTTDEAPRQVVHSPEQVELHLPVAGPTTRMLAYAIDLVAIVALEIAVIAALFAATPLLEWLASQLPDPNAPAPVTPQDVPEALEPLLLLLAAFLLLQLAVEWGYFIVLETTTGGRSLGKAALGLRVVRDGGLPISLRDSLVRNLLRAADMLPANYVVGLVAMVVSEQGKRLGDVAAGTVVVRLDRPARAAPLPEGDAQEDLAFRFERAQIARLGPRERMLVRQTLRRHGELGPDAAEQALELAVEALRARLEYAPVPPDERLAFLRALWRAGRVR